jgi:UDP-2-acetamido-3-amino-2,3-dideoxy-glucuronate N-acetyltransferase
VKRDGPTETIPYDRTPPLTRELAYFVNAIDKGVKPGVSDVGNPIEVLEILERASESLLMGESQSPAPGEPSSMENRDSEVFVHASSYVDDGAMIGAGTKIWHFSHVQSGACIGENCSIGQNVNIGNNVHVGNHVKIQNNVSVYEGVELEDYVFCGPSMVFTNVHDPRSKYPQKGTEHYRRTRVKQGASIGANATVLCGHTIGKHAFIAAGAVVSADVPDYALMKGVPARRTGWMCECGEKLPAGAVGDVQCARCERRYAVEEDRVTPYE